MRRFWHSLLAVVAGNAIYLLVQPYLPARAQHQLYAVDWGLAVDFWICVACYGVLAATPWFKDRSDRKKD